MLAFSRSDSLTFSNAVSGSGSVDHARPRHARPRRLDTYTGGTTISGGTLQLGNAAALGSTSGAATVSSGVLDLHGYSLGVGGLSGAGTVNNLSGAGTYTLTVGNGNANGTFSGAIKNTVGTIALTKTGTGTLTLAGSDTYSGGTTLSAGQLNINHASALGTGTFTISGGTIGNTSGAAITLSTNNAQNWNSDFTFAGTNDLNLGTGAVTMSSSRTVTVASNTLTVGGAISGSGDSLTKAGTGTLTLAGSDTYSGGTTLSAGQLNINAASALATGTFTISGGTIGNTSGTAITLSTNNAQNWNSDFTFAGTNDLNLGTGAVTMSSSRTVTVASNNLTVGGVISDSGSGYSLTKAGAGALTLAGSSTYTGPTTISGGTLQIGAGGAAGSIDGTSGITDNATLAFSRSDSITFSKVISGSGNVAMLGPGTLVLGGSNTYTGGTTLSAGQLNVNNAFGLSTGTLTIAGGTLGNASGAAVTLSTNNAQIWSGNFTFAGANDLNLGAGAVALNGSRTVTVASGNLFVAGAIGGSGGSLTKAGSGTLTLGGANTYGGATVVSGGTLQLAPAAAPVPVGNASFETPQIGLGSWSKAYQSDSQTLLSAGTWNFSGYAGIAANGAPFMSANAPDGVQAGLLQSTETYSPSDSSCHNGVMTQVVNFSMSDSYVVSFEESERSGSSNDVQVLFDGTPLGGAYTGSAGSWTLQSTPGFVATAGTHTLTFVGYDSSNSGDNSALIDLVTITGTSFTNILPVATPVSVGPGATLNLSGNNQQVASLSDSTAGSGGTVVNSNTSVVSTLTLSATGGTTTFSGVIAGGAGLGTINLVMSGSGVQVLAGPNTFTGPTTLSGGTLQLDHADAVQYSTVNVGVDNGLAFGAGVGAFNVGGLAGRGSVALTDVLGGPVTLYAGGNNANTSYGGSLGGAGGLTKTGSGTLTLTGTSVYAGLTSVTAGTLQLVAPVAAALLVHFGFSGTVGAAVPTGAGAVLDASGSGNNGTMSGAGATFVAGRFAQGINLGGQYLTVPASPTFDDLTAWTDSIWVNLSTAGNPGSAPRGVPQL